MKKTTTKKITKLVETYGLSFEAVSAIKNANQSVRVPLDTLLRRFAKFFLAAESREELKWKMVARNVLAEHFTTSVEFERVKPVSFNLPVGQYTPDFQYTMSDGMVIYVEVKGSKFQPNYRDARARLRASATLFPEHTFLEVMPNKEVIPYGWSVEVIEPDNDYESFITLVSRFAKFSPEE